MQEESSNQDFNLYLDDFKRLMEFSVLMSFRKAHIPFLLLTFYLDYSVVFILLIAAKVLFGFATEAYTLLTHFYVCAKGIVLLVFVLTFSTLNYNINRPC